MPVMDTLLSMAPGPNVHTNVPTQTSNIPDNLAVSWVENVPKIFQINIAKAKKLIFKIKLCLYKYIYT